MKRSQPNTRQPAKMSSHLSYGKRMLLASLNKHTATTQPTMPSHIDPAVFQQSTAPEDVQQLENVITKSSLLQGKSTFNKFGKF